MPTYLGPATDNQDKLVQTLNRTSLIIFNRRTSIRVNRASGGSTGRPKLIMSGSPGVAVVRRTALRDERIARMAAGGQRTSAAGFSPAG
jgi:hypothetical protein